MENKELLEKVIKDRLILAKSDDVGSDSEKESFKEAMDAVDRLIEIEKLEKAEKEQRFNKIIKVVEVAAIPAILLVADHFLKLKFAREICNFEKDYTFTTTPGRSISSFFRFKK